jgi:O-antigen/teichoic acid export membrane protein
MTKRLKADPEENSRLFEHLVTYLPATIVPALVGLLSTAIITREVTTSQFGIYSLILATSSLLVIPISQLVGQPVLRFVPGQSADESNNLFLASATTLTLASVPVVISVMGILLILMGEDSAGPIWMVLLGSIYCGLLLLNTFSQTVFQAELRPRKASIISIIPSLGQSVFMVALVLIWPSAASLIIGAIIGQILVVPLFLKQIKLIFRTDGVNRYFYASKQQIKRIISYGAPMAGWFLFSQILNAGDKLIIAKYLGPSDVAIYSASYTLTVTIISFALSPLLTAAHPLIMRAWAYETPEEVKRIITSVARYTIIFGGVTLTLVILFRNEILSLFAKEYASGSEIVLWVGLGFIIWRLGLVIHKELEFHQQTLLLMFVAGISAAINIVLNILFVLPLGLIGSAIATTISYLAYSLIILAITRASLIHFPTLVLTIIRVSFTSAAVLVVSSLMQELLENAPLLLGIAIIGVIAIAGYLFVLVVTGEIKEFEIVRVLKNANSIVRKVG